MFKAPVDDILFSLEHVAQASEISNWDGELAGEIIRHFGLFAEAEIAPLNENADKQGCRFQNGEVFTPDGFKQAYDQYVAQGWHGLAVPEKFNGQQLPTPLLSAITEIFTGACHSLEMIVGLVPGAIRTLQAFGNDDQQNRYISKLASGDWLATMCMTEANAGSDLSGIRTSAKLHQGEWQISGGKIFISGGGQDISPCILHLVLARTGSLEDGVKGLSLFLCPSHFENGVKNKISVDRLEHKMGLHGSPTCQMLFDGATAELLGGLGQGLKAMFTLMNHARLDVGLQGVAHAANAARISADYAAQRVQGKNAVGQAQVAIDQHFDVQQMLQEQQALTLGGRSLCHIISVLLETGENANLVDFLTPICKVFCSEAGIKSADMGIQILGGYGYLHEYRVEQILRDARITSIYEGTNSVHGIALVTRLLHHKNGIATDEFENWVKNNLVSSPVFELWREKRIIVENSEQPSEYALAFMRLTAILTFLTVWQKILAASTRSHDPKNLQNLAKFVNSRYSLKAKYWASLIVSD